VLLLQLSSGWTVFWLKKCSNISVCLQLIFELASIMILNILVVEYIECVSLLFRIVVVL
jgi:hypothetical protein